MLRRFALLDQTRQNGVFFINFRRTHYHFVFGEGKALSKHEVIVGSVKICFTSPVIFWRKPHFYMFKLLGSLSKSTDGCYW